MNITILISEMSLKGPRACKLKLINFGSSAESVNPESLGQSFDTANFEEEDCFTIFVDSNTADVVVPAIASSNSCKVVLSWPIASELDNTGSPVLPASFTLPDDQIEIIKKLATKAAVTRGLFKIALADANQTRAIYDALAVNKLGRHRDSASDERAPAPMITGFAKFATHKTEGKYADSPAEQQEWLSAVAKRLSEQGDGKGDGDAKQQQSPKLTTADRGAAAHSFFGESLGSQTTNPNLGRTAARIDAARGPSSPRVVTKARDITVAGAIVSVMSDDEADATKGD